MTRRKATAGSWFANQLWNTSLPWLAIVSFGITGFYFLTNAKLTEHDKMLMEFKTTLAETKKEDVAERSRARETFLIDSKATAMGIAELNKQTAITSTQLLAIKDELARIATKIDGIRK